MILVTGATGFIGRRLVSRLASEGTVRALVLPSERALASDLWKGVEIFEGDITRKDSVMEAARGCDTVFHLAAIVGDWGSAALHARVTVGGTMNALSAACAADARFILISSVVVYGEQVSKRVCSEDVPHGRPLGPYSRSKQAQERIAREFADTQGLRLTIVRPTNVYGPGSGPWVHDVVEQLKGGLPCLLGGGDQNAGLCHVDNLVDLLVLASRSPRAVGRVYNACDGSDITWKRYFTDLARAIGAPHPKSLPLVAARAAAPLLETAWSAFRLKGRPPLTREALNLVGSHHRVPNDRAREELGFSPRVPYDRAIREIADSLAAR